MLLTNMPLRQNVIEKTHLIATHQETKHVQTWSESHRHRSSSSEETSQSPSSYIWNKSPFHQHSFTLNELVSFSDNQYPQWCTLRMEKRGKHKIFREETVLFYLVENSLNTKTHSSKVIAEFSFENADVKSICCCKERMKSKPPSLSSECVETKLCKPCTSFTSNPHSLCAMVWYRTLTANVPALC